MLTADVYHANVNAFQILCLMNIMIRCSIRIYSPISCLLATPHGRRNERENGYIVLARARLESAYIAAGRRIK